MRYNNTNFKRTTTVLKFSTKLIHISYKLPRGLGPADSEPADRCNIITDGFCICVDAVVGYTALLTELLGTCVDCCTA